jgi:uncharacterized protein (DUF1778 family)
MSNEQKTRSKTTRINIRLTPQEREKINRLSYQENKTISQLIRERFKI